MEERSAADRELKAAVRRGIIRHLYQKGVITRPEAERLLGEGRR